ncbi:MAG: hypothetical protein JWN98_2418 [Abditibacteriota bacterium]|nr:hypothetical protein [Abditibacteriota bacterium]
MKPRFFFPALWSCLLFLTLARSGMAQQPNATPNVPQNPIGMELASPLAITDKPFSVLTRFRRWFPLAVTLSNSGDPVRGTLTLRLFSSSGDTGAVSTFVTEVDLPTVARKRVWLYGRLERGECDQAEVTFRGRGIETLGARFDLRAPDAGSRVVLTISDRDEKLAYLGGMTNRRLGVVEEINEDDLTAGIIPNSAMRGGVNPNSTRRWVQPLGKSHEWIPERWIGLDAVDAVVLQDFPHTSLTPAQLTALRGYVAAGGALIALGGSNWQRLSTSPLADLWPVTLTASSVASSAEVSSLVENYVTKTNLNGGDRLGGAPVLMSRGTLKPGAVMAVGSARAPLLVLNRSGAGQVLFLSVDPTQPPFLGWSGLSELWATVFGKTQRANRLEGVDARLEMPGYSANNSINGRNFPQRFSPYTGNRSDISEPTNTLWTDMVRSPQLRTPPVSYIAWFLALYVFFLVPVNYCILRYLDRRELAWVTVPVIVVGFSMMSYFAAVRIKGTVVRTRHVNIVQSSHNSGVARADAMMWLFSPRKSTYTVAGNDPSMAIAPYLDGVRNTDREEATIAQPADAPFVIQDTLVNMWDFKTFVGQSVVGIGRGISVQPTRAGLQISNNTQSDLRGVVVVTGGQVAAYSDVSAGQSTSKIVAQEGTGLVDPSQVGAIQRASQLQNIFPSDGADAYQSMAKSALTVALGARYGTGFGQRFAGSMLIAWSREPLARLAAQGEDPQAQDVTLWLVHLPAGLAPSGTNRQASAQAVVKLVDVETLASDVVIAPNININGRRIRRAIPSTGQRREYEADFGPSKASARAVIVEIVGDRRANGYSRYYNGSSARGTAAPLTQIQAWNFAARRWQTIGAGVVAKQTGLNWSWQTSINANNARDLLRADGTMRVRFSLPHEQARALAVFLRRD